MIPTEVKIIALILAIGGAALLGVVAVHKIYDSGYDAGFDKEKLLLDAYEKTAADAATAAAAQNASELAEAKRNTQEQHDDYEAQLATVNATAANIAERLRRALAASTFASGGSVSNHSNGPSNIPPSATPSTEQITSAVAAAAAECLGNDDALDAVYNGLAPQLAAQHK